MSLPLVHAPSVAPVGAAAPIGRAAIRALYAELALHPKPGLVSPLDSGSHRDMDMSTFMRSLFALRGYYRDIAAAGWLHHAGKPRGGPALGDTVAALWGGDILAAAPQAPDSNGAQAIRRYGARGARQEAAEGFPTLFTVALPALARTLDLLGCAERAMVQTLFALMATLDDTNLLHRGGAAGLAFVQAEAQRFLDRGGVFRPDWRADALALHEACIGRHLSPGGSADMLAAAWFVHSQQIAWG